MELRQHMKDDKVYIEAVLASFIDARRRKEAQLERRIYDAMAYSLMAGGKRLRPMMLLETYRLFEQDTKPVEAFFSAIEMVHTYSLIHDDLPAMDNDDLRRGRPTCHIEFGEDMAILAGDGLLTMAFEIMAEASLAHNLGERGLKAMACLGQKAGTRGMVGGQVVDIQNENKAIDLNTLSYINLHKTSALLEGAFMMGGYLAGATEAVISDLEKIGRYVGLAFQIQDDILDVTSTGEKLGKPIGSDQKNAKTTYVNIQGMAQAKADVKSHLDQAEALVRGLPVKDSGFITSLIAFIRERDY